MRKKMLSIVIGLAVSTPVVAEKVVYACQYVGYAGMAKELGNWVPKRFENMPPFFLSSERGVFSTGPVATVFNLDDKDISCRYDKKFRFHICSHVSGMNTLLFSPENLQGAITNVMGAMTPRNSVVTLPVTVGAFTCTKM